MPPAETGSPPGPALPAQEIDVVRRGALCDAAGVKPGDAVSNLHDGGPCARRTGQTGKDGIVDLRSEG